MTSRLALETLNGGLGGEEGVLEEVLLVAEPLPLLVERVVDVLRCRVREILGRCVRVY